MTLGIGT